METPPAQPPSALPVRAAHVHTEQSSRTAAHDVRMQANPNVNVNVTVNGGPASRRRGKRGRGGRGNNPEDNSDSGDQSSRGSQWSREHGQNRGRGIPRRRRQPNVDDIDSDHRQERAAVRVDAVAAPVPVVAAAAVPAVNVPVIGRGAISNGSSRSSDAGDRGGCFRGCRPKSDDEDASRSSSGAGLSGQRRGAAATVGPGAAAAVGRGAAAAVGRGAAATVDPGAAAAVGRGAAATVGPGAAAAVGRGAAAAVGPGAAALSTSS